MQHSEKKDPCFTKWTCVSCERCFSISASLTFLRSTNTELITCLSKGRPMMGADVIRSAADLILGVVPTFVAELITPARESSKWGQLCSHVKQGQKWTHYIRQHTCIEKKYATFALISLKHFAHVNKDCSAIYIRSASRCMRHMLNIVDFIIAIALDALSWQTQFCTRFG